MLTHIIYHTSLRSTCETDHADGREIFVKDKYLCYKKFTVSPIDTGCGWPVLKELLSGSLIISSIQSPIHHKFDSLLSLILFKIQSRLFYNPSYRDRHTILSGCTLDKCG